MAAPAKLLSVYPHQKKFWEDDSRFVFAIFARQTGKTHTMSGKIAVSVLRAFVNGTPCDWVVLSRSQRQSNENIRAIAKHIKAIRASMEIQAIKKHIAANDDIEIIWDEEDHGFPPIDGKAIKKGEIILSPYHRVIGLPSTPDTCRGFSANVCLDEFALHAHSREIWAAIIPMITRGEKQVLIGTTPFGLKNKAADIWHEKNDLWSKHFCTIHDAEAAGYPVDAATLKSAMSDPDKWLQEYECIFLDEASAYLPFDLINACESEIAGEPDEYKGGPCVIGIDVAIRNDLWVAVVLEEVGDVLWTREVVTISRGTFAEREAAVDVLVEKYRVVRINTDQTGLGENFVEVAKDKYGEYRVEGVMFTPMEKLDMAQTLKKKMQDRQIRIPMDRAFRYDLHSVKKESSPTGKPRFGVDKEETDGHADRFWALSLAVRAAGGQRIEYGYHRVEKFVSHRQGEDNDDDNSHRFGGGRNGGADLGRL